MILSGLRVIDCGTYIAGPAAAAILSDFGAEVIKIEERENGDPGRSIFAIGGSAATAKSGHNFYFEANNRHKQSLTLNLSKPEAREIVYSSATHQLLSPEPCAAVAAKPTLCRRTVF